MLRLFFIQRLTTADMQGYIIATSNIAWKIGERVRIMSGVGVADIWHKPLRII